MSYKSPPASRGPAKRLQFKLRGNEMNRIEAVSDVVFGFALTLLVVSLQVPRTYVDLVDAMRGFPAFALAFAALMAVWARHYFFFRRYGLDDPVTIVMNTVLLFVVLFYVYPLKFLCDVWLAPLTGMAMRITTAQGGMRLVMAYGDVRGLMLIFGSGFAALYLVFGAMYWHAWRMRAALQGLPSSASKGPVRYRTDPAHPKAVISCASDSNPVVALSPGVPCCTVLDAFGYDW